MSLYKKLEIMLAKMTFRSRRKEFYSDLAEALDDNGAIAIFVEKQMIRLKERKDAEAALFQLWLSRMDETSFADALRGTVPDSDVMILRAAEGSKSMSDGLRVLAMAIEAKNKMVKALVSAIAQPMFVLISSFGLSAAVSIVVVPMLSAISPPATWPMLGKWLYAFVEFEMNQGPYVLAVIVALMTLVIWSLPRWVGKHRTSFDRRVPLYSLYREFCGASFIVALASLLRTGSGISEALNSIKEDATPWLKYHIEEIQHNLDGLSGSPAKAFATGVFSQSLTDRIEDFGDRADFNHAMGKVGLDTIDKVTESVVLSSVGLNIFLTLIGALLTVFVNVGVILVSNTAGDSIQHQVSSFKQK